MLGINKVILIGLCGQDPTLRYTAQGQPVAELRIATHQKSSANPSTETKTHTEWHTVIGFQRLADIARDQLYKGVTVYVEGRLNTETWTDKNNQPRRTTKIVAQTLVRLSAAKESDKEQADHPCNHQDKPKKISEISESNVILEELPF